MEPVSGPEVVLKEGEVNTINHKREKDRKIKGGSVAQGIFPYIWCSTSFF